MSYALKPLPSAASRRSGLATVELALVLPLLILVLAGVVQFGGLFYLQNKMVNLARDAARRLSVGEITTSQANSLIQSGLSTWNLTFTTDIHIPAPGNLSDKDVVVTISVPKAEASLMDIFGMFQSGNLVATIVARKEAI